jgi:RNA polymerase sigma-70 factor (ECF subfamily)
MTQIDGTGGSLDDWFEAEVLRHEASLTRYLRRAWPNQDDVADLRQEVYIRVYESAARQLPDSPRAFLLATARNLVFDRVRRERIVSIDLAQDFDPPSVLVDGVSPEQRLNARQELRRLSDAIDQLPVNCRAVIWLRRVDGLSQREVAQRLGMQEGTVASHLARGLKVLTKVVLGGNIERDAQADRKGDAKGGGSESERG